MPLTVHKIEAFLKKVTDLTDTPSENMSPADIKAWLDSSPEELRTKLNALIDDLTSESAANLIGAKDGVTVTTIQALLDKVGQNFTSLEGATNTKISEIEVIANDANDKSDFAVSQANNIIATAGNSNTEIVDGRLRSDGTATVNVGSHIREVAAQLAEMDSEKASKSQYENLSVRMEDVIQSADLDPNKDQEVVDARHGANTLGSKIEFIGTQLESLGSKVLVLENEVINGSFENGKTGWTTTTGTSGVVVTGGKIGANELKLTGTNASNATQPLAYAIGDVMYFNVWGKRSTLDSSAVLAVGTAPGTHLAETILKETTPVGEWNRQSLRVSMSVANLLVILRTVRITGTATESRFDGVTIINLTETYGVGKEPTKAEMDALLTEKSITWIEGAKLIDTIEGRVMPESITIPLALEASGLDKTTGIIVNSLTALANNDFENRRRTGKYLKVIPKTNIRIQFEGGSAFIFEYDKGFNFIKNSNVSSGIPIALSGTTVMVKVLFENLTNPYSSPQLTYLSEDGKSKWIYNQNFGNVTNGNITFTYESGTNEGRDILINNSTEEQYSPVKYFSSGILKLPPNYNPHGKPVKLIMYISGSSSYIGFGSSSFGDDNFFKYFMDEGYAMLDVYKWTNKYENTTPHNNFGSPTSYAAFASAYKWAVDNYNIAQNGVFVSGISIGGLQGLGLSQNNKGVPVTATGLFSPSVSPFRNKFGDNYAGRLAFADDFGFEGDHSQLEITSDFSLEYQQYLRDNAHRLIGYNPLWDGLINADLTTLTDYVINGTSEVYENYSNYARISPVPVKIWGAEDDVNVPYSLHRIYIKTVQNGNGIGELRTMPNGTGGHRSVDSDVNALKVASITTKLGITHTNVPLAYVELIQWFRRFEN